MVFFVSVFSPRVVGIAVARYDFCSRDTRELSLLQGDIIRIYTKMSNGWWKGEIDGRVGLLWDPVITANFCTHFISSLPCCFCIKYIQHTVVPIVEFLYVSIKHIHTVLLHIQLIGQFPLEYHALKCSQSLKSS